MSFLDFKTWFRKEWRDIARYPLKHKTYNDEYGWIADPSSPDPRRRERLIAIDKDKESLRRMLGDNDRRGGMSGGGIPSSEEDYHDSPMIMMLENVNLPWEGKGSKASSSAGMECCRCQQLMNRRESEIVEDPTTESGINYQHKNGSCVGSEKVNEFGGRRRGI